MCMISWPGRGEGLAHADFEYALARYLCGVPVLCYLYAKLV